jgi:hypothetical protein
MEAAVQGSFPNTGPGQSPWPRGSQTAVLLPNTERDLRAVREAPDFGLWEITWRLATIAVGGLGAER